MKKIHLLRNRPKTLFPPSFGIKLNPQGILVLATHRHFIGDVDDKAKIDEIVRLASGTHRVRIYETFKGLRFFVRSHHPKDLPFEWMALCDRNYQRMVKASGFRARLEPLPERMNVLAFDDVYMPPVKWEERLALKIWRARFQPKTLHFGVCRLLEEVNSHLELIPGSRSIIQVHDGVACRPRPFA